LRKIFFLLAILFAQQTFAQRPVGSFKVSERFISSFGLNYSLLRNTSQEKFYGINATPSLNLLNSFSDFSISFALSPSAAYHPTEKMDSVNYFSFSFPTFIQANIGHLASHDFYSSIGFFIGAGYGYFIVNKKSENGITLTTGLRFWFLKKSFTLRYTKNIFNQTTNSLQEFSLQLNAGSFLQSVKDNNKLSKFMRPFQK
jgi:hypothetical protein